MATDDLAFSKVFLILSYVTGLFMFFIMRGIYSMYSQFGLNTGFPCNITLIKYYRSSEYLLEIGG